jgi:uncharacterized protein
MNEGYEKPLPYIHSETGDYWEGTRRHELLVRRCRSCGKHHFYPRDFCPSCFSYDIEWTQTKGRGIVYSFTICHRPAPGFEKDVPYNLAIIELDEGVRMMSTIVDCAPDEIRIGMAVKVIFDDVTPQVTLPKFTPVRLKPG